MLHDVMCATILNIYLHLFKNWLKVRRYQQKELIYLLPREIRISVPGRVNRHYRATIFCENIFDTSFFIQVPFYEI
jgi:hypothetical protein